MNKFFLTSLVAVVLGVMGCDGSSSPSAEKTGGGGPISVVATTGMIADVARNIAGEHARVTALMGAGVDPHLYKASTGDVRLLSDADLVLYNGLHLEGRMADLLVKLASSKRVVQVTDSIEESRLREPPEFEGHADPHVWFDVSLWAKAAERMGVGLAEADPANAEAYKAAAGAFAAKLDELHAWCKAELEKVPREQRVLVTAHDAFGYFGEAYGLDVLAIQGISTDSEASLKSMNELVDTIVSRKVRAVFVESSVPHKTIESLVEGCRARGHEVRIGGELFSDALGAEGTAEGTYIGMVRHNVETIVRALTGSGEGAG